MHKNTNINPPNGWGKKQKPRQNKTHTQNTLPNQLRINIVY